MTRDEAVARIQRGLGFRTDLNTAIISALQEAQRSLEQGLTLPWFLREQDATLSLTSSSQSVSLPTDFIRFIDEEPPHYFPSGETKPVFLEGKDYDDLYTAYGDVTDSAVPKAFALRKSTVMFFPAVTTTVTIYYSYFKRAEALTSNIENVWLEDVNAPEYLIGAAGMIIARDARDKEALAIFGDMKARAQASLLSETIQRETVLRKRYVGGRQ